MAHHDEMIWQIINNHFCSYKTKIGSAKSDKRDFCKHPYSVTGLCNRSSCPLSNSKYAVVREKEGRVSLFIKTPERCHSPKNMWEEIHLSRNYDKALAQLDEHLQYYPKNLIHRNKQRLTKIHQMLIRMRKIKLKQRDGKKEKLVHIHRKIEQREERREKKALVAAKVEQNIEKELLERLANGTYGDIYNFEENGFQQALEKLEEEEEESEYESDEEEEENISEYVEDLEEESESEEEELELDGQENAMWDKMEGESSESEDDEDSLDEESSSSEDDSSSDDSDDDEKISKKKRTKSRKNTRRGTRVEIEYENEEENEMEENDGGGGAEPIAGMAW